MGKKISTDYSLQKETVKGPFEILLTILKDEMEN